MATCCTSSNPLRSCWCNQTRGMTILCVIREHVSGVSCRCKAFGTIHAGVTCSVKRGKLAANLPRQSFGGYHGEQNRSAWVGSDSHSADVSVPKQHQVTYCHRPFITLIPLFDVAEGRLVTVFPMCPLNVWGVSRCAQLATRGRRTCKI